MAEDKQLPTYPNNLRAKRTEYYITQAQLSAKCSELAANSPLQYVPVSLPAIRLLEAGNRRPRATTAVSLAIALSSTPAELFPAGIDDPIRNPEGKTRISPDRRRGGRPRKKSE